MPRKRSSAIWRTENVILQKSPGNKYREINIVSDLIVGGRREKYDSEEEYSKGGRKMKSRHRRQSWGWGSRPPDFGQGGRGEL